MATTCSQCRFYFTPPTVNGCGECRRDPPVARLSYNGIHDDLGLGVWPLVLPEHWCGVFEPRPVDRSQRRTIAAQRR